MGYALQLGAWSSVIAVPGALIDKYIKIADGDQLKVILWLLRHNGRNYSAEEIAEGTGLSVSGVESSIRFWVENELLSIENDILSSTLKPAASTAPVVEAQPAQTPVQILPAPKTCCHKWDARYYQTEYQTSPYPQRRLRGTSLSASNALVANPRWF